MGSNPGGWTEKRAEDFLAPSPPSYENWRPSPPPPVHPRSTAGDAAFAQTAGACRWTSCPSAVGDELEADFLPSRKSFIPARVDDDMNERSFRHHRVE